MVDAREFGGGALARGAVDPRQRVPQQLRPTFDRRQGALKSCEIVERNWSRTRTDSSARARAPLPLDQQRRVDRGGDL